MFKLAIKAILAKSLRKNSFGKHLNETQLKPLLKEIKLSLLSSDVNLSAIEFLLDEIKTEILSKKNEFFDKQQLELTIFKTIKEKLIVVLGNKNNKLKLKDKKLNKILFVGMNGSGKTTSVGKLSYFLKNKEKLKVKNASLDIHRPGAFDQLQTLSDSVGVECFSPIEKDIFSLIEQVLSSSYEDETDVVIFDTAGVIPEEESHLQELKKIYKAISPTETIYVLDAMAGQDALDRLKLFHQELQIDSLIVSKADSKAPMGAAFSVNYLLNIPIKFLGEGERVEQLVEFHANRIVGQILGEGDIFTLAEKIESVIDKEGTESSIKKLMSGRFDLNDLIFQIKELKKLGSMQSIMKFLPNTAKFKLPFNEIEKELQMWEIIVSSMTIYERKNPKIFKKQPSRKARVVKGCGKKPDDLNKLLKKWEEGKAKMEDMQKKLGKGQNLLNFL